MKIGSDMVCHHLHRLRFDGCLASLEIGFDETRKLTVVELFALEHHSHLFGSRDELLSAVDTAVFVTDDENGGFHRFLEILFQGIQTLQILCFFYNHHPEFRHHRISLTLIHHLYRRSICPEKHGLVEVPLFRLEHVFGDIIADLVYIERFVAHQNIHGRKLPSLEIFHDRLVTYCIFLFCH